MKRSVAGFVALLLPALILIAAMPRAWAAHEAQLGASIIELPVTVELSPLARLLEQHIPRWIARRGDWEGYRGFDVQYGVRRGPVRVAMFGEDLHVQIPVSYWIRARKKLVGRLKVTGSCGVDEPPRSALLHVAVRLRWTPDWRLVARSVVLPVRYLNPCQMTMARLDVTPLLDRYVREKLAKMVAEAVDARIPHLVELRSKVAPVWTRLNRPLPLGEDSWLLLRPQAVRVAPFLGSGPQVSIVVGLVVRPRIGLDETPAVSVPPLPRLEVDLPRGRGLELPIQVELGYRDAADELARRLAGSPFKFGTDSFVFSEPKLSASGERLVLTLRISRDLTGRVTVSGRPVIDADTHTVSLQELNCAWETDDPVAEAYIGVFRGTLLRRLSNEARWSFSGQIEDARRRLAETLNRRLTPALVLRTEVRDLRPISVRGDEQHITAVVLFRAASRVLSP